MLLMPEKCSPPTKFARSRVYRFPHSTTGRRNANGEWMRQGRIIFGSAIATADGHEAMYSTGSSRRGSEQLPGRCAHGATWADP